MWWILVCVIFLCTLHYVLNCNEDAMLIKRIPGARDDFLFGNAISMCRSPVELMKMLREFTSKWDGIFRIWISGFGAVCIYNPQDIELIMSNVKYHQKSILYDILKPWLHEGLLVSNGAKWQHRRKILTPAFHFNILRQFSEIIAENSRRLVETLEKTSGNAIDVVPVISESTLNSICETAMGTRLYSESINAKPYRESLYKLGELLTMRAVRVIYYHEGIFNFSPMGRKQKKLLEIIHKFTKDVIKQRRENFHANKTVGEVTDDEYNTKKKTAMLDLLLAGEKEGIIDEAGIQEEVDTFMFEGHDTTGSGLTLFFMLLANHKDIQNKIYNELKEIFGDSDRIVKMEDLPKMKYLECCIKESLRLYPPVHFISRVLNETTVLSNYKIPAGTNCHILIYDLHRRADLFPDPDRFDPDRFLPENSVGRHPYAYIPFSAGARNCIGQKFAMMNMKMVTAEVIRHFKLEPITRPEDLQFVADLVLRNQGPVLVKFKRRQ